VRASNLQELVYKGGQAGVTKATVTITFDNSDKKQSPVGYETFDELTVSRQVNGQVKRGNFCYKLQRNEPCYLKKYSQKKR
jgi:chromosome segregation ATPase